MFMFPSNSKVKISVSYMIVLRGGAFGKGTDHEGGTLGNVTGDTTEPSCPFSLVRTQPDVRVRQAVHLIMLAA